MENEKQDSAPTRMVPTIGRKVYFSPGKEDEVINVGTAPYVDATVIDVFSDTCVSLHIVDVAGVQHTRLSAKFVHPDGVITEGEAYARWMPYQVGQAKKAEALQEKLDDQDSSGKDVNEPEQVPEEPEKASA